jgi:hypothetical protein
MGEPRKNKTATEGVRPWLLLSKMGKLRIYSTGDRRTHILIGCRRTLTPILMVAQKFLILKRMHNSKVEVYYNTLAEANLGI